MCVYTRVARGNLTHLFFSCFPFWRILFCFSYGPAAASERTQYIVVSDVNDQPRNAAPPFPELWSIQVRTRPIQYTHTAWLDCCHYFVWEKEIATWCSFWGEKRGRKHTGWKAKNVIGKCLTGMGEKWKRSWIPNEAAAAGLTGDAQRTASRGKDDQERKGRHDSCIASLRYGRATHLSQVAGSSFFFSFLLCFIFMHFYALSLPHQKKIYEQTIPSDSTQSHGKRLMIHKLVAEGTARPGSVQKSFRPLWAIAKKKQQFLF